MDEEETRTCTNCKRDIPASNFTIHSVHCARNIRVCPVCKEPVPQDELRAHHETLHAPQPCKQCGESVCGSDLEDHIRDSCALTIRECRYCSLELTRRELPAHEGYCGARTEQCEECREWVMIKYRQLHLDSNHGFLRLDDDPQPVPRPTSITSKAIIKSPTPIPSTSGIAQSPRNTANGQILPNRSPNQAGAPSNMVKPEIFHSAGSSSYTGDENRLFNDVVINDMWTGEAGMRALMKSNINHHHPNGMTHDRVKKHSAPPRSNKKRVPPPDPRRDLALASAVARHRREEAQRDAQNQYNLAHGLPPVLNPAQKLEKLRKMDALHNRELPDPIRRRSGRSSGCGSNSCGCSSNSGGCGSNPGGCGSGCGCGLSSGYTCGQPGPDRCQMPGHLVPGNHSEYVELTPMSPEEFMRRFQQLQVSEDRSTPGDRFDQIKSSLQQLRRGLNEVTAPYNANAQSSSSNGNGGSQPHAPSRQRTASRDSVRLPCEFCGKLVPANKLVKHQTGCRPDLARFTPAPSPAPRPAPPPDSPEPPVIPCEFCTESLPVYLINEHQERCRREPNRIFPD